MADQTTTPAPLPAPRDLLRAYRICVVCLGNICRSPMAEAVLRAELALAGLAGEVEVDSAGTGDWHVGDPMDRGARAELARRGHDGASHRARQFEPDWFSRYDLVLAMDRSNLATLRRMAQDCDLDRMRMFRSFDAAVAGGGADHYGGEVPDPYGRPDREYALAFDLIVPAARGLVASLAAMFGASASGAPDVAAGRSAGP